MRRRQLLCAALLLSVAAALLGMPAELSAAAAALQRLAISVQLSAGLQLLALSAGNVLSVGCVLSSRASATGAGAQTLISLTACGLALSPLSRTRKTRYLIRVAFNLTSSYPCPCP